MGGAGRRLAVVAFVALFTTSACAVLAGGAAQEAPAERAAMPRAASESSDGASSASGSRTERRTAKRSRQRSSPAEVARTVKPASRAKPASAGVTIKLAPRPKPGPFAMNLYGKGDFMHQQTKDWCVAGSTQIMMNIIEGGKPNRSKAFQKKLYFEGRRLSHNQKKLGKIGMDLTGWMELLNTRGYGPYVVAGAATRRAAIRKAARAIRQTGKPVGLATWRGAHSWVMSGFTATADPAFTRDFEVRKVYIQDTWYPYVSTIWGASRKPNALVPVAKLAEDFLPYRRPSHRYPGRDGKFMLVLPTLPANTVTR